MKMNDHINEFLGALNRKIPGIHIEEYVPGEYGTKTGSIKFRAEMSNLFCQPSFHPSRLFYDVVNDFGKKYFGIDKFNFNNTGTIFWFYPEEGFLRYVIRKKS